MFFCLIFYIGYAMPFKATDPNSPFFSEQLFRLRDYGKGEGVVELRDKVLPKLFPVGTSKEYVDLMLVNRGGAEGDNHTTEYEGYYIYRFLPLYLILTPDAYNIRVYYDKNNKVEAIHFARALVVGSDYKPKIVPHIKPPVNSK